MDVGIGLPNAIRGVEGAAILDWARRAEAAGFSSLGTLDRLVYGNCEALVTLAAAAAVTERVRLVTDILIAPLRGTAMLAKQAATVDRLSGGRLVLGLAVGGREDDFAAAEADFAGRGRAFERQLDEMARIWRGEAGVGPAPARGARPQVLIGGRTQRALRRAPRHADGFTSGGGPPGGGRGLVPQGRAGGGRRRPAGGAARADPEGARGVGGGRPRGPPAGDGALLLLARPGRRAGRAPEPRRLLLVLRPLRRADRRRRGQGRRDGQALRGRFR